MAGAYPIHGLFQLRFISSAHIFGFAPSLRPTGYLNIRDVLREDMQPQRRHVRSRSLPLKGYCEDTFHLFHSVAIPTNYTSQRVMLIAANLLPTQSPTNSEVPVGGGFTDDHELHSRDRDYVSAVHRRELIALLHMNLLTARAVDGTILRGRLHSAPAYRR